MYPYLEIGHTVLDAYLPMFLCEGHNQEINVDEEAD